MFGTKRGDEVILPSLTIISCILPLMRRGLVPVFIDTDPNTWNMNVNMIQEKLLQKLN